jgi:hypothetical protein
VFAGMWAGPLKPAKVFERLRFVTSKATAEGATMRESAQVRKPTFYLRSLIAAGLWQTASMKNHPKPERLCLGSMY